MIPRIVWRASFKRKVRAMKSAARAGMDPYNSAATFGVKYERAWKDAQRRG